MVKTPIVLSKNNLRLSSPPLSHHLPTDTRQALPQGLAEVADAWLSLPDPIRAGILAMVRATQLIAPATLLDSQKAGKTRKPRRSE
jgi:hypothetical protein